jgi:Outer membrane protein Omp28/Secretion system C-terminal sorting domain
MKKLFPFVVAMLLVSFSSMLISQEMVSTDPQNRNVILEEFTGIHCGWCPAGHLIGSDLSKANPDDVFLVNIHAGGYATPGAGEIDLRTDVGEIIDDASGLTGYPAGSVNRNDNPWAMSRSLWASKAASIMAESSPVNVAVKGYADFETRELVVDVEYYYTTDSPSDTDYLTVMLTQSNIIGTQSGASLNPDQMTADGMYRHGHALRMILTEGGAFGEPITTTKATNFEARQYKITLPADIKGIPVELWNLEVVAFVSGNKDPIYSGHGAKVGFDQKYFCDLALENKTVEPEGLMFTMVHPIIEVTNNSGNDVTTFDVVADIAGNKVTKTFDGTLASGEKTTIDWGELEVSPAGTFVLSITGFENINNGDLFDMDASNNSYKFETMGFTSKAYSEALFGFNTSTMPPNCAFDLTINTNFYIYAPTTPIGANGTRGAVRFALHGSYGVSGLKGRILTGAADLSQIETPYYSFYYAYSDGSEGGSAPAIHIEVSTNYGATWDLARFVTCEETGQPAAAGQWYVPKSAEYKRVDVPLTSYGDADVLVRLQVTPGPTGNALYIDEIIFGDDPSGVEELENISGALYPNPAVNEVSLNDQKLLGKQYMIYSILGNVVAQGTNTENKFNVGNLNAGSYYIRINNEIHSFIKK